jgi:hypothetical protein
VDESAELRFYSQIVLEIEDEDGFGLIEAGEIPTRLVVWVSVEYVPERN